MEIDQLDDYIAAAQNGDRVALGKIIDIYAEPIHSFIYHTIGRSIEVEDLAQDTFVKMITNIQQYRPTAPFRAWLFRIALNVCRDHLRKKKVRRIMSSLLPDKWEEEMDIKSPGPTPDKEADTKDYLEQLNIIVSKLPENLRTVFLMRDVQDMSYEEISAALNWQMGTVKSRLNRARTLIAQKINLLEENPDAKKIAKIMERNKPKQ